MKEEEPKLNKPNVISIDQWKNEHSENSSISLEELVDAVEKLIALMEEADAKGLHNSSLQDHITRGKFLLAQKDKKKLLEYLNTSVLDIIKLKPE